MKKKANEGLTIHLIESIAFVFTIVVVTYMVNSSYQKKVPVQYRASVHLLNK